MANNRRWTDVWFPVCMDYTNSSYLRVAVLEVLKLVPAVLDPRTKLPDELST